MLDNIKRKFTRSNAMACEVKTDIKKVLDYKLLIRYIVYFAMMVLLAMAKGAGGISPFHLGLFVALVYCRENVFLLSMEYMLALIISDVSIYTLIVASVPPAIFILATIVHKVMARPMKLIHANVYALACQLPVILLNLSSVQMILNSVAMVVISQIFTYCVIIITYAMLIRGVRYRFAKDELFGGAMLVVALSMGLYAINIANFTPFYIVAPLVLMMCLYADRPTASFLLALALGIGAGIMSANIMIVGGLMLCVALSMIFITSNVYFATLAYLLGDLLVGAYFKSFGSYGYEHLVLIAIGLFIFVILPKRLKDSIIQAFGGGECVGPERAIVNRNRRDISTKLVNMSNVFSEIGGVLGGSVISVSASSNESLSREIAADYCGMCPNINFCTSMLGGDTSPSIKELVDKAMYNGEVTESDLPPFIASRCSRASGLLDIVASKTASMVKAIDNRSQISAGRIILGEQMLSISELLRTLANDVKHSVFFDSECEKKILEELSYHNIVARDIIVSGENGGYGVTMSVRKRDAEKSALVEVVGNVLKNRFNIIDRDESDETGYDILRLHMVPRYSMVYGVSNQTMTGSIASGDTYSVERIGHEKIMLALCDGMGSGEEAKFNSTSTINMIENFYKAGFNNNNILSLINKILATYNGESFTCLDMSIIDLAKGSMDIIKLGGVQSLMLRHGVIDTINCGALPLGIVEEAEPYTDRRMLMDGDVIVMFTDGITDALTIDGVSQIMLASKAVNPQALSDEILMRATTGGARDDSTVIVARIYTK